jgi:hypothetical protein
MGKRRSKRTANAKQAALSRDPDNTVRRPISWIESEEYGLQINGTPPPQYGSPAPNDRESYAQWRLRVGPSNREKLVLDALSKAGVTFDPSNSIDAQWLKILHHRYDEGWDPPTGGNRRASSISFMSFPRSRIQDTKSRFATERVLSEVRKLRSAFLLLKQEIERDDIPSVKLNVALNMVANLTERYKEDEYETSTDEDIADWIAGFNDLLNDVEWAAALALKAGVHAPHGKSNMLIEYTIFVRGLYDFWTAKKSQVGVYKSGGRWTGPFVELVEKCEELLSPRLRPPSANARGKRVARAIGAHKKANPS